MKSRTMPARKKTKGGKRAKGVGVAKSGPAKAVKAKPAAAKAVPAKSAAGRAATVVGPIAALQALSSADVGYDGAMKGYGALGLKELRALCESAGLVTAARAKHAKIPGLLDVIVKHAVDNAGGADAAKPTIPRKRAREAVGGTSESEVEEVLSADDGNNSIASTPVKSGRAAVWPTIRDAEAASVISAGLAAVLRADGCKGYAPAVLMQVVEGFRPYFHAGGAVPEVGRESAVMLDVRHIAQLTFAAKDGVTVPLPATTPFTKERVAFLETMQSALLKRVSSRLEVACRDEFEGAFHAVVQAVVDTVYTPAQVKMIAKEVEGGRGAAATKVGKGAADGVALEGGAEFQGQYRALVKAAQEHFFFDGKTDIAGVLQAKKMAAQLRALQPAMPAGRATDFHQLRAPFDETGRRKVERRFDGTVLETSEGAACGVTAFDAETTAVKEGEAEAAAFTTAQYFHCVKIMVTTTYVLVVDQKDGEEGVPRFSTNSMQRSLAAAQRLSNVPSVTPAMFSAVIRQAYERAATVLDEREPDAPVSKDGLVGAAYAAFTRRVLEMVDHYALTARAPTLAAPVAKQPPVAKADAKAAKTGGGKGAGDRARLLKVRLPGGCGKGYKACALPLHDPAQGGNPAAWCGLDHSHWQQPQPDPKKLRDLQFKVVQQRPKKN